MSSHVVNRFLAAPVAVLLGALIAVPAHGRQPAAAPNDSICDAWEMDSSLGLDRVFMEVTTATPDLAPACGIDVGHTVWFKVILESNDQLTFSTCDIGTTYDTVVQVWTATDCEWPVRLDDLCNDGHPAPACFNVCDESWPNASMVSFQATAGVTYYFQVGSYGGNEVECDLYLGANLVVGTPPANDDCIDAAPIGEGSYAFDTTSATTDGPMLPVECNEGFGLNCFQDIWYLYTASCTGLATVDLCANDYDTRVAVYAANGWPGDFIACNDDRCGLVGRGSRVQFHAEAGSQYLLRVAGYSGGGTATMVVSCAAHMYLRALRFATEALERGLVVRSYEDFSEANIPDPPGQATMNDPLDESTDNEVFAPGDITAGLVLQSNLDGAGEGGVNPRGESGLVAFVPVPLPNPAIGPNIGPDGLDIVVGVSGPIGNEAGVGLWIADLGGAGEIQVSVFDINDNLLTQSTVIAQPSGSFVGAIPINIPSPGEPVQVGRINLWSPEGGREGVYEISVYAPPPPCPADVDSDNDVDFQDLLQLLAAWGPCTGCPADIDFDNDVDFQDLLQLLAAWGSCV